MIDMAGQRWGKLVVIAKAGPSSGGFKWLCQCDCGNFTITRGIHIRTGNTRSCGRAGCRPGRPPDHGHAEPPTPTYSSWRAMITRCTNPNDEHWRRYGGRGITICERWLDFNNFLADMGVRPPDLTLDRINPDGNYEPNNCRWATALEQRHNRSENIA